MLTRIKDRKIPCVYIHVYIIIKNRGLGLYNLYVTLTVENIFRVSLSNVKSKGSAHVLLDNEYGENLEMLLLKIWSNLKYLTIST